METKSEIKTEISRKRHLTEAEKTRIERNKLKAISLRQAKLVTVPQSKSGGDDKVIRVEGTKFIDSGGGFLIEENIIPQNDKDKMQNAEKFNIVDDILAIPVTYEDCLECGDKFADSYLFNNFAHAACDKCRDPDEKHCLITKTEAKQIYLLKDCDIDRREPILKFITRKNPHNSRWGDMKLFLHLQIEKRALEIWGSEEDLEQQRENRVEKREVTKIKKFNKQMKELRMNVRSSLYDKTKSASHNHEFGPDTYNEDEDTYTHSCLTCDYVETFEKM